MSSSVALLDAQPRDVSTSLANACAASDTMRSRASGPSGLQSGRANRLNDPASLGQSRRNTRDLVCSDQHEQFFGCLDDVINTFQVPVP